MQAAAPLSITPARHLPSALGRIALAVGTVSFSVLFCYYLSSVFYSFNGQKPIFNGRVSALSLLLAFAAYLSVWHLAQRALAASAAITRVTLFGNPVVLIEAVSSGLAPHLQEAHWLACVRVANLAWCRFRCENGSQVTVWFAGSADASAVLRRWHSLRPTPQLAAQVAPQPPPQLAQTRSDQAGA